MRLRKLGRLKDFFVTLMYVFFQQASKLRKSPEMVAIVHLKFFSLSIHDQFLIMEFFLKYVIT